MALLFSFSLSSLAAENLYLSDISPQQKKDILSMLEAVANSSKLFEELHSEGIGIREDGNQFSYQPCCMENGTIGLLNLSSWKCINVISGITSINFRRLINDNKEIESLATFVKRNNKHAALWKSQSKGHFYGIFRFKPRLLCTLSQDKKTHLCIFPNDYLNARIKWNTLAVTLPLSIVTSYFLIKAGQQHMMRINHI